MEIGSWRREGSLQRLQVLGACGCEQTIVEADEGHIVLDPFLKMETAATAEAISTADSRLVAGTSAASSRCTFKLPFSRTYRFTTALASK